MCQDTGTAIVKAKKGQFVITEGGDEAAIAAGVQQTYLTSNLRYSQMPPVPTVLDLVARGRLDLEGLVSARFALDEAQHAYDLPERGEVVGRAVIEMA
jgi:Zn-dependent alcohol dehydrogenase